MKTARQLLAFPLLLLMISLSIGASAQTTIVSQNFDSLSALPSGWTSATGSCAIGTTNPYGGTGKDLDFGTITSTLGQFIYTNANDGNGGDVQAVGAVLCSTTSLITGITVRTSSNLSTGSGYMLELNSAVNNFRLRKRVSGTSSDLAVTSSSVASTNAWYMLTLKAVGTTITGRVMRQSDGLYLNSSGSWVSGATDCLTATDSSIAGAGFTGFYWFGGSTSMQGDEFVATTVGGSSLSGGTIAAGTIGTTTASFTSSAAASGGTSPYSYQWERAPDSSGSPGTYSSISGATSATLSDTGLTASTTYWYRRKATDSAGSPATAYSNAVSITTNPAAATSFTMTGPSSGLVSVTSTNFTVTPNGPYTGTITPSDGGNGGTFTPSSLSYSSESTAKTFTYTPASTGVKTISASASPSLTPPSSISYTVTSGPVVINCGSDPNIRTSPWSTEIEGTGIRIDQGGSYLRWDFTGTSCVLNLIAGETNSSYYNIIRWSVDNAPWQYATISVTTATNVTIATGLANTTHRLDLEVVYCSPNRFTRSGTMLFNYFTLDAGASSQPYSGTTWSTKILTYGDSLNTGSQYKDDLTTENWGPTGWGASFSMMWGAEFGQIGYSGTGWNATGTFSAGAFSSSWSYASSGHSLLTAGKYTVMPDIIVINHGTNDSSPTGIGTVLSSIRAAANPTTWIFVVVPFNHSSVSQITSAVSALNDPYTKLIDLGNRATDGAGFSSRWSVDGVHLARSRMMELGGAVMAKAKDYVAAAGYPPKRRVQ